jgi:hypothetical protein
MSWPGGETRTGRPRPWPRIGNDSNFEILVDTISLRDGQDIGVDLSEASTEVRLLIPGCDPIHLILNL